MKTNLLKAFLLILICLLFAPPPDCLARDGVPAIAEATVNGITVKIVGIKQSVEKRELWSDTEKKIYSADKKALTFDVCFSAPDSGDWSLWGTKDMLTFDQFRSWVWDRMPSLRDEKPADGKTMGEKCERYTFDFGLDTEVEPPFTLRFDQLFAARSKALHPCAELLKRFATNPRAVSAGLDVGCDETATGNPPGLEFKYNASVYLDGYDESVLTGQEAHVLMLEIESGVIYGPWVFTIESMDPDGSLP